MARVVFVKGVVAMVVALRAWRPRLAKIAWAGSSFSFCIARVALSLAFLGLVSALFSTRHLL